MKLVICNNNKEFNERFKNIKELYELETQLFFVNTINESQQLNENSTRGGVYDDFDNLVLLFLDANPFRMQLFGINNSLKASKVLAEYFIKNRISFKGILGNKTDTKLFIDAFKKIENNVDFIPKMELDIMVQKELIEVKTKGTIRKPLLDDKQMVLEYIAEFHDRINQPILDEESLSNKADEFIANEDSYIYTNSNNVATSIVKGGKYFNGAKIHMVITKKEHQGNGYATSMMYMVCKKLFDKYNPDYITLFVDKNNPVSNHVYKKIGYKIYRDQYEYEIVQKYL
jgi:ribosomal protein S18 acetylase RimI-like enzyme